MQPIKHTPDEALALLKEGNARYIAGDSYIFSQYAKKPTALSEPNPFVCILSCSDSRVPPQIIFDRAVGDLFIIRVAGAVLDEVILASIQFAMQALGVSLVVALGHTRCGAVKAAIDGVEDGYLGPLTKRIKEPLKKAQDQLPPGGDLWLEAVKENSIHTATQLSTESSPFAARIKTGKLKIQPALYDLETGQVNFYTL